MMYGWLYRSVAYTLFLVHQKWLWASMVRVPFFAPLLSASVVLTWLVFPIFLSFYLLLVLTISLQSSTFMELLPFIVVGYLIVMAPICVFAVLVFFDGLRIGLQVWASRSSASAQCRLQTVVSELEERRVET